MDNFITARYPSHNDNIPSSPQAELEAPPPKKNKGGQFWEGVGVINRGDPVNCPKPSIIRAAQAFPKLEKSMNKWNIFLQDAE